MPTSSIDWFEWNGVKCTTKAMHVLSQPTVLRAPERVEEIKVPGRAGSLTMTEGEYVHEPIVMACDCVIDKEYVGAYGLSQSIISNITGWLHGNGTVKFANRKEGYYKARVVNQIGFDKILRGNPHMAFQVQFRCQPYMYLDSGATPIMYNSSPANWVNPGNMPSEPLLRVTGTGGTIMCGSDTFIINQMSDISYLMLDCEAKLAYTGIPGNAGDPLRLMGTRVMGDWFTMDPGSHFLQFGNGITSVQITPRWRML